VNTLCILYFVKQWLLGGPKNPLNSICFTYIRLVGLAIQSRWLACDQLLETVVSVWVFRLCGLHLLIAFEFKNHLFYPSLRHVDTSSGSKHCPVKKKHGVLLVSNCSWPRTATLCLFIFSHSSFSSSMLPEMQPKAREGRVADLPCQTSPHWSNQTCGCTPKLHGWCFWFFSGHGHLTNH
jgi:hypothetical protein